MTTATTTQLSSLQSLFLNLWNQSELVDVKFNPNWKNGTGYLDYVTTEDLRLEPGTRFKFEDDFNRRAIGVVVRKGVNFVAFERYSPKEDQRSNVVVLNAHPLIKRVAGVDDGSMTRDSVYRYVGDHGTLFDICNGIIKNAALLAAK